VASDDCKVAVFDGEMVTGWEQSISSAPQKWRYPDL